MAQRVLLAGLLALLVAGCSPTAQETPEHGLRAIIQLYEARDFDALIRTRHAEIGKAQDEAQIQALVERFETTFAEEAMLARAIATYRAALEIEPELDQEGAAAVFRLEEGFVKLSRMEDGRWGFHL